MVANPFFVRLCKRFDMFYFEEKEKHTRTAFGGIVSIAIASVVCCLAVGYFVVLVQPVEYNVRRTLAHSGDVTAPIFPFGVSATLGNDPYYDERYFRVTFTQRSIFASDSDPSRPRIYTPIPIVACTVGENGQVVAMCPDVDRAGGNGYGIISGEYISDEYHFMEIGVDPCPNYAANPDQDCASTEELEELLYGVHVAGSLGITLYYLEQVQLSYRTWGSIYLNFERNVRNNVEVFLAVTNAVVEARAGGTDSRLQFIEFNSAAPRRQSGGLSSALIRMYLRMGRSLNEDTYTPTMTLAMVLERTGGMWSTLSLMVGSSALVYSLIKETQRKQLRKKMGLPVNGQESARPLTGASMLSAFITAGGQLDLTIGIDFGASNGGYSKSSKSLHTTKGTNQYRESIAAVVDGILAKLPPALPAPGHAPQANIRMYGFGGEFPARPPRPSSSPVGVAAATAAGKLCDERKVICQSKRLDESFPPIRTAEDAVNVYDGALADVKLSSPTHLTPLIQTVVERCHHIVPGRGMAEQRYTVLIIFTDGDVWDLESATDALVEASEAPLSIVIVGVGSSSNFKAMETLDSDRARLRHSKTRQFAKRDIVQFVAYNDPWRNKARSYSGDDLSLNGDSMKRELIRELLEEVPVQFSSYMMQQLMGHRDEPSTGGGRAAAASTAASMAASAVTLTESNDGSEEMDGCTKVTSRV